jgi:tetratricopeptide (TPR) repeat protein
MRELEEGLTFGARFRLIRQLGRGGMGEVWLARDEELNEDVALKVLDPELAKSPEFVELLRSECSKARRLVHPNIVRVYDFHSHSGRFFISMQFIDGASIAALHGERLDRILTAVLPIADALEFAHQEGIIHRDIKVTNVLTDQAGNLFLGDFGIASAMIADGPMAMLRTGGSLPSMSPQQFAGETPSVTDDVYSFGALIYELIAGQPLFDPAETGNRIPSEQPKDLASFRAPGEIPDQLAKLIAAMTDKDAVRRPAGMGAVRAILEEVSRDVEEPEEADSPEASEEAAIAPVARRRGRRIAASDASTAAAQVAEIAAGRRKPAAPGRLVYIALGSLALLALGVIVILPRVVDKRQQETADAPAPRSQPEPVADEPLVENTAALEAARELADDALGTLLTLEEDLKSVGVDLWGGVDWAEARLLADSGDEHYKARNYADAAAAYRRSIERLEPLGARAPEIANQALLDGVAAIEAGDKATAMDRFQLVLAIQADHAEAKAGMDRAISLDRVLELMASASALEIAEDWNGAQDGYQAVLDLDPQWSPARDGLQRIGTTLVAIGYESTMSAGYSALAARNFSEARRQFEEALRIRPGDRDANSALEQIADEQRLARIIGLRTEAEKLDQAERWPAAAKKYEQILQIDSSLAPARQALQRAQKREELNDRMNYEINSAEKFNEQPIWQRANEVLTFAQSIEQPGPILAGQISQLVKLLEIAATPVPVQFESDNLTIVVIYKVGNLGTFVQRTLSLRPGTYVAVGSRDGYRDVRRDFRVAPGGRTPPVVLRCEDPI